MLWVIWSILLEEGEVVDDDGGAVVVILLVSTGVVLGFNSAGGG